jgi:hypothetical protein
MSDPTATIEGRTYGEQIYTEGEAASDLTPGEVLVPTGTNSAGETTYDTPASADATGIQARFAQVPSTPPQRDGSDTDPVDQTIASGTHVETRVFRAGDTIKGALLASGTDLSTASEANVSVGDTLGVSSDGSLKVTSTAGAAVAVAVEAIDNSGAAAGERARIEVEVL